MSSPPDYSLKNLFTNMAALGYEYDCIGLQIWLRRLTEPYP